MCAIFVQELRLKALIINYNLCKNIFCTRVGTFWETAVQRPEKSLHLKSVNYEKREID
jgi:hypothetical protein